MTPPKAPFLLLIAALLPLNPLAWDVNCQPPSAPIPILAPLPDCAATLKALDLRWRQHGQNFPRTWGRTVLPNPEAPPNTLETVPEAFFLRSSGPGEGEKKCEFFVDNVEGMGKSTDVFTLQQMVGGVMGILEKCFPRGMTGFAFPGLEGTVSVTVRYRDAGSGAGNGDGGNVTEVALDEAPLTPVVLPGAGLTQRRWVG